MHKIGFCLDKTMLYIPHQAPIVLEIANDYSSKIKGFMFRQTMSDNQGMLFKYDHLGYWSIWMKNMNFPIDIIWLSQDKKVIDWIDNAPICPKDALTCPLYRPRYPALEVIELKAGQRIKRHIELRQSLKY
jgi:uncharacterized protein